MTKRYKTLQKKVKELKAQILYLFSLPPPGSNGGDADVNNHNNANNALPYDHHQQLSEDIQHRFLFAKKLLSAEVASHPSMQTRHLRHISKRLAELESAFRGWDHRSGFSDGGEDDVTGGNIGEEDDMTSVRSYDDDEDDYLCREDGGCGGGEASNTHGNSNMRPTLGSLDFPEGLVDVKVEQGKAANITTISDDDDDEGNAKEEQILDDGKSSSISKGGGYWGGLISGMIFGALLMGSFMFRFSAVPQHFLIPT